MLRGCLYNIFIHPFVLVGGILWNIVQLIPYFVLFFLIALLMFNLGWIGFDPLGGLNPFGIFDRGTTLSRPTTGTPATNTSPGDNFQLVFRFEARGDQIYYLGNPVDEAYVEDLARQAKGLDAKVEVLMATDVTVARADSIRDLLNESGVPYEIVPLE